MYRIVILRRAMLILASESTNSRTTSRNSQGFQKQVFEMTPRLSSIFDDASTGLTKFLEIGKWHGHWVAFCYLNVELGFRNLLEHQRHDSSRHISMTVIAVVFSLITATLLASAVQRPASPSNTALSVFWFLSLSFGVTSAVNSVLGLVWSQSSA